MLIPILGARGDRTVTRVHFGVFMGKKKKNVRKEGGFSSVQNIASFCKFKRAKKGNNISLGGGHRPWRGRRVGMVLGMSIRAFNCLRGIFGGGGSLLLDGQDWDWRGIPVPAWGH